MRSAPRGLLRIDAPITFGSAAVAPALAQDLDLYPEVRVDLTLNNRLVDLIEEGYGIVFRIGDIPDSGLLCRALAPYPLMARAAPSYLKRRGEPRTLANLQTHECLGFHPGAPQGIWTFLDEAGEVSRVKVSGRFSSNNGQALRAAAVSGVGIVLQATALLREALLAGKLRPVLQTMTPKPLPMHVLYAPSRSVSLVDGSVGIHLKTSGFNISTPICAKCALETNSCG